MNRNTPSTLRRARRDDGSAVPTFRAGALARAALCIGLAGAGVAALALDYPPRKPGLWEMSVTESGGQAAVQRMQQCIDARTDKLLREMGQGAGQNTCSKNELRADGPRLVVESVCQIGPTTAMTRAVVTGDFGSSYRMEMNSRYSPPLAGKREADTVVEARWVGPCQSGQRPGDMVMGGMKMNVLDMMGMQPRKK